VKEIKILLEDGVEIPKYETSKASGMDMRAWKYSLPDDLRTILDFPEKGITLQPHERVLIKTGIKVELPDGYEFQLRPRSGLSLKKGIVAQLGTIDEDYTGDIGIILLNTSNKLFTVEKGERYGQIVFSKVDKFEWNITNEIKKVSDRGEGGFGHTGE